MPRQRHAIDYLELPTADVAATRAFYEAAFGWTFQEWGPTYLSFAGAGLDGGFDGSRPVAAAGTGPLTVLYSDDLAASRSAVEEAGGVVTKPPFEFPGGRRFHFRDPGGNELAVWSE